MKTRLLVAAAALLLSLTASDVYPISSAVKSSQDYAFTLDTIRQMRIMVENFGDDQNQLGEKFKSIKAQFQDAGEKYYGQDFTASSLKFTQLKMQLISILETIDSLYLTRTKKILDSTAEQSFDTLIEYTKQSGLAQYFARPYDPLRDIKPYNPENYHLYHDRQKIENYLREGYRKYHRAKNIFEDPDIAMLRKRDNLTIKNINHIIKSFTDVVFLCREAKQNGIEIHKLLRINELGKSLVKYDVSHGTIIPIYDDRIPEEYKLDANDNMKLIHSKELQKLKKYTGGGQDKK
ncbi:MAG TPA: hypothetical protein PLA65_14535 [Spirochaetota bacterium]|nr:hypothetical protein [Spirochaetota bacterium]HOD13517.1 hypothetical protein [Spirochaetota bacterium]HPG51174.1 hypothetical protein [Spirochaetota bacterium]HPN13275.1 hypothetical protein [Spirochaetota bacterium]